MIRITQIFYRLSKRKRLSVLADPYSPPPLRRSKKLISSTETDTLKVISFLKKIDKLYQFFHSALT